MESEHGEARFTDASIDFIKEVAYFRESSVKWLQVEISYDLCFRSSTPRSFVRN